MADKIANGTTGFSDCILCAHRRRSPGCRFDPGSSACANPQRQRAGDASAADARVERSEPCEV